MELRIRSLRPAALEHNEDVSVIVLTKNSARTIARCVRSIIQERPGEIVVVDSLSVDGTLEILKPYGVRILTDNIGSLGFSRQLGVQAAMGAFVMFVDSDVELGRGCITTLRADLRRRGWAGVHAKLASSENTSYWQKAEDQQFQSTYRFAGLTNRIDTIAAMFRREILLRYPFDPTFKESAEDVDLSRRLVRAGYRLGVSTGVAFHYHRREFSAFVRQKFRNGMGSARICLKYGEPIIIIDPLLGGLSQIIRGVAMGQMKLVPYWVVSGFAKFLGVLTGLWKARSTRNAIIDPDTSVPSPMMK